MNEREKSSSIEQIFAEEYIFADVERILNVKLEKNPKLFLSNNQYTYIQPDFYSAERLIVGEIFAHIGKPKKAQDNKIANDILKMLLFEKVSGRKYRKIIAVCDEAEKKKLLGMSVLSESIRQFGIEVIYVPISEKLRDEVINAQRRQRMTNV
ncbi:MAG: hypothetical protein IJ519_03610 [Clostridia bacterium]|nr:hypothetical protein [Clostridia bacterium]